MAEAKGVSIRFPDELLEKVKEEAERCEMPVSAWVLEACRAKLRDEASSPYAADVARLKPQLYAGVQFTPNASAKPRLKGYDALTGEPIYEAAPAARPKASKEKSK